MLAQALLWGKQWIMENPVNLHDADHPEAIHNP